MVIQTGQTPLVLGSASPRRRELLKSVGIAFEVEKADLDESVREGEPADRYVLRVAREKAQAIAARRPGALVLAADTTVVLEGRILGKPTDAQEAEWMLEALSGRDHQVMTAVCLGGADQAQTVVNTRVHFRVLTHAQIRWYVRTGEPMDKAGAYGLQGIAAAFIERVEGSVTNVIGLPLAETLELLDRAGVAMPWKAGR